MGSKATTRLKNYGDSLFREGKFQQALITYRKATKKEGLRAINQGEHPEENGNHLLSVLWDSIGQTHLKLYQNGHKLQPEEPVETKNLQRQNAKQVNGLYLALNAFNRAIIASTSCVTVHGRRSQVFQIIKHMMIKEGLKTDQEGINPIEIGEDRDKAKVIVDITQMETRKKKRGKIICNNLIDGVRECKEGQILFIENGQYHIPETIKITKGISIIGASMKVLIRCDRPGTRESPLAACCIEARNKDVTLKNMKLKIPIYILSCANLTITQCLFEGDKNVTLVKVAPESTANTQENKNQEGEIEQSNIDINNCVFISCEIKNPILIAGTKTRAILSNCLVEKCRAILVHGQAQMEIRNCELKEGFGILNSGFLVMAANQAVIKIIATTITTGRYLSGIAISYRAVGNMTKILCTATSTPAKAISCFILADQAGAEIKKSRFINLGSIETVYQHTAIIVNRQSTKESKIVGNHFRDCANAISINNGAGPAVTHNSFAGSTNEHICIEGGANPRITKNTFEMQKNDWWRQLIPMAISYKGNSSGSLLKNKFIDADISIKLADKSHPTIEGNTYQYNQAYPISPRRINLLGDKIINNNAQEVAAREAYNQGNDKSRRGRNRTRGCAGCSTYKECALCANCKSIYYCSKQCQTNNWEEHAPNCKDIRDIKINSNGHAITRISRQEANQANYIAFAIE